jgi:hypothetical protein
METKGINMSEERVDLSLRYARRPNLRQRFPKEMEVCDKGFRSPTCAIIITSLASAPMPQYLDIFTPRLMGVFPEGGSTFMGQGSLQIRKL